MVYYYTDIVVGGMVEVGTG